MDDKTRAMIMLFKNYCKTFNLTPTADKALLTRWKAAYGAILVAAFDPPASADDFPPVVWIDANGTFYAEQDEDLLKPDEPAISDIAPTLVEVAINNKQAIHVKIASGKSSAA